MPDTTPTLALDRGRRVSLLPRTGGHLRAGTVGSWDTSNGRVVASVDAAPDAVSSLDHHQVWLSTVTRGDEHGVTVFSGRAFAVDGESLRLEGVVRVVEEKRRRAVRAPGGLVSLQSSGAGERNVASLDISRSAVRLPVGDGGWGYPDPLDLVVQLRDTRPIYALAWLLRIDVEAKTVVLGFDSLSVADAEAIDRFVLTQLADPAGGLG